MRSPASSSDDDDDDSSSSSSSTPSQEGVVRTKPLHRRSDGDGKDMSGDGANSNEDIDSGDDSEENDDVDDEVHGNIANFDDLPTDDSEDDDDSSGSDTDDDDDHQSNSKKKHISRSDDSSGESEEEDHDEDEINQEDIPISERMASRAGLGRRYYTGKDEDATTSHDNTYGSGGKQQKAERKQRAIQLASERLKEARKGQRKDRHSDQSSSDDNDDGDYDSSIEQTSSNNNFNPTSKTKKSKHAPTVMSSKRHDYFSRGRPDLNSSGIGISIGANKYKARDPRMISLSGHLDADAFEKRYGFLDDIQEKEIELLKSRVKAWKTSGKRGQKARRKLGLTSSGGNDAISLEADQEELTRLLQERAERQRANVVRAAKRSVKSKLRTEVASGKRGAYYPKRSELKKMEAEAKFDEIRKRGGDEAVDAAIAKRRKKNVSKEARSMPSHMIS
jgi:ribosomal RNA-processing protein 36